MSVSREVEICCDGVGCSVWERASMAAAELRKALKAAGWSRVGARDYCPGCTKYLALVKESRARRRR